MKKKGTSSIELYKLMGLDDVDFDFEFSAESAKSRDRPPEKGPQLLLTTEQARHTLQISRSHLYTLLARGKIASVTIGRSRRIPVREIERYIEQEMEDDETI